MDIQLSCHHSTLTKPLRDAVHSRFERLAGHTNRPTSAHVVLTVDNGLSHDRHQAEATVLLDGKPVHASSRAKDMYAAIDRLVSRLDRRLRKIKTAKLSARNTSLPLQPTM